MKMLAPLPLLLSATLLAAAKPAPLDVPYEMFRLDDGLTVILHKDENAPASS